MRPGWAAAIILGACILPTMASQVTDLGTLIEQALDESPNITLDNIKLSDAINELYEQTGVKIVMPPETMNLVPHGGKTIVQHVEIANIPLREGLVELFSPLGMTFAVMEDHIRIVPKEALLVLGRRATWAELDTLSQLSTGRPGTDADALAWLRERLQFRVSTADPFTALAEAIRRVGAGPGDEVLSIATASLGWGWSLSDTRIVVDSLQRQILRQLQVPISIRVNDRPLFDVLTEVGKLVNVPIREEPGTCASLPPNLQQSFFLDVSYETAELVLD